jgi:hypothetical protein
MLKIVSPYLQICYFCVYKWNNFPMRRLCAILIICKTKALKFSNVTYTNFEQVNTKKLED